MTIRSISAAVDAVQAGVRLPALPRTRNAVIAAATLALVVTLAVAAALGQSRATLPVDVRVLSTGDPLALGATSEATVALRNHAGHDVTPRFSVSWLPYPYYWHIVSGPDVLRSGQSATYKIVAPDSTSSPPDGVRFRIKVNAAESITYAISAPIAKPKRDLPIVNPGLQMWTQRDLATLLYFPAGWNIYQHHGSGDRTTIGPGTVDGVEATRFHVVQDGLPDPGLWSDTGLMQTVPFPDQPFDVRVFSRTPYEAISGGWLLSAFGIEIRDGQRWPIWILFEHTGNGDREYDLPNGFHVRVYDVPAGEWTTRTVDLAALYRQLHRSQPALLSLKLFIAASSDRANDIDGYIAGIALHAAGSRDPLAGAATNVATPIPAR
ncbi:MAG: hypothetical protein ACYDEB_08755 [Dehalococcoidia bacterium]